MIAFYKDFILEFFSENSWLGLKSKISNNEKENLEYKLNFLSVSLTHFKLIFHFFFFFFFFFFFLLLLVSYVCNLKVGKRTWIKNLSSGLVEKTGSTYHKQKFWRNQIPGETRFPAKPDSRRNQIPSETRFPAKLNL